VANLPQVSTTTPAGPVAKFTASVIDTGGKVFASGVAKFTAGITDIGGKFLPLVVHLDLRISPPIFEQIRNDPNVISRGTEWHCPIKLTVPRFPYNLFPVPCGNIGLKKKFKVELLAWKKASKCLQVFWALLTSATILLSDLVECGSPLKIILAISPLFLFLKGAKRPFSSAVGCCTVPDWMGSIVFKNIAWRFFFKDRNTFWGYNTVLISDEYERVNKWT
jgi:hypothetical protein